ncbi:MAG: chromosomal replication initiator protein DnaA [Bacteroidaceae bacterium]|nr:chromosomal replication initiator protein DnaA [Bacteroidaceae bacterium]
MTDSVQILWRRCMDMFRSNVSEQQFQTWFSPMRIKSYDAARKELAVFIPSQFFFEYLEEHFRRLIHITISRFFGEDVTLSYEVEVAGNVTVNQESDSTMVPAAAPSSFAANKSPQLAQAVGLAEDLDSQLNVHQSFSNFIEGTSNKLPRSVGQAIAEHPEQMTFNPLFIYGPSGVGKTHLVNAIGMRTKELHPSKRVLYLSAHLFMVQFTDARKNNVFNDFMHFYQSIDMLIVDDIQELAGMTATQNAFFHIFNHLRQNGKQIIMTCDRPPVSLQGMEDRLITRFKSGLMAEMEKPEEQLRRSILHSIVKHDGLSIPDEVVNYISHNVTGSVRELEGIVHSLLAYSVVYGKDIDLEFAQRILAGRIKVEKKDVTIDQIITCTCEHFNVREEEVFGKSRKANIVTVRQVSMYLAHKHTKLTASKIGIYVGNRDHATVLHGIKTIDGRLKVEKELRQALEELESKLIGKAL